MTDAEVELVQRTLERAVKIAPHLTRTFYSELFAIDPTLRSMFKTDMIAQAEKLLIMLADVVDALGDADDLDAKVHDLAVRHASYGVQPQHYQPVGVALLRALRHELGAEFTPELRAVWARAYQRIADAMCNAAYGTPAPRA